MPKPKSFLKETKSKKKSSQQQAPRTADEFLAVGVEQEEAGEKWRAGDAAKSLRFFMRAIATYDEGLQRHPIAFDLAYNKARVQYEITQHPRLAAQLSTPLGEALSVALSSHREALVLEQDNADALFNTAQVLTSLAEAITDTKRPIEENLNQAAKFLQESIDLFQRCLVLQEQKYTEMQVQIRQMESGEVPQPAPEQMQAQEMQDDGDLKESEQEQWAAVVEPVTRDTLVDTAIAQLDALSTLCSLLAYDPGVGLNWVEEYSTDLLHKKVATFVEGSNRQYEAGLSRGRFNAALNEVLYRSGRTDVETYHAAVVTSFSDLNISADPEGLCAKADAFISFNTATAEQPPSNEPESFSKSLSLRWQALSAAIDALTKASKLPDAENLPKIHLARGDSEMSRWRLGFPPWEHDVARQHGPTLLRNAQTYYRGAAALARRDGSADEDRDGTCKEAIAAAIEGQKEKLAQLKNTAPKELLAVAEDMVEDGWVSGPDMEMLLS